MALKLIKNSARCKICGDVLESKHRHDFVTCKCGNLFIDGGTDYMRTGYCEEGSWENLSEYVEEDDDDVCSGD